MYVKTEMAIASKTISTMSVVVSFFTSCLTLSFMTHFFIDCKLKRPLHVTLFDLPKCGFDLSNGAFLGTRRFGSTVVAYPSTQAKLAKNREGCSGVRRTESVKSVSRGPIELPNSNTSLRSVQASRRNCRSS